MVSNAVSLRPVVTLVVTLVGTVVGGVALGYGAATLVSVSTGSGSSAGFAALAGALYGSIAGAALGAIVALLIAFRADAGRVRAITIAVMIVGGAVLFLALAGASSQIGDGLVEIPTVWLAVALPLGALLGRWIAVRTTSAD